MNMRPGPTIAAGDQAWWQALLARDARFDNLFVYGVRSTGVYCRASCPSRKPGREQVEFYANPQAAARAGYRPCRRCRPDALEARDDAGALVRELCREIDSHIENGLTPEGAGKPLATRRLSRHFKRATGLTPRQYQEARRLPVVKERLRRAANVTEALYEAGYGSSRALYERAARQLGMTPATYRNGGRGASIRYTVVPSPLGQLLVASTRKGVFCVKLGGSGAALRHGLACEYPQAQIRLDRVGLSTAVRALVDYLSGKATRIDLPLDIRATAFQWRVWRELAAIPRGSTRSYREVAQAIGQPRAVRAVARACAMNPVAVIIPCHRVIQSNGGLGGYRWGIRRKRALLALERRGKGRA